MVGLLLLLLNEDDFTLLQPTSDAVGVFLVIPAAYGAGIVMLTDRWLRPTEPDPVLRTRRVG